MHPSTIPAFFILIHKPEVIQGYFIDISPLTIQIYGDVACLVLCSAPWAKAGQLPGGFIEGAVNFRPSKLCVFRF